MAQLLKKSWGDAYPKRDIERLTATPIQELDAQVCVCVSVLCCHVLLC